MFLFLCILFTVTVSTVNSQMSYNCNVSAPCGCSSRPATMSRIIGGEIAENNTWGWLVWLSSNGSTFCSGTLVSASWVLTTKLCSSYFNRRPINVSAGSNILFQAKQIRTASLVIEHPQFSSDSWINNIALIRVSSPFNMSDPAISRICLPTATNEDFPSANSLVRNDSRSIN